MKKPLHIKDLFISEVSVVRQGQDHVYFTLSDVNMFGEEQKHIKHIHGGHEEFNSNDLVFKTVRGNGVSAARLLGWMGEITVVDPKREPARTVEPSIF